MTPKEVYCCIEAVLGLPLPQQAACVTLAAVESAPVWSEWCRQRGVQDNSYELLAAFDRWLGDLASDEELNRIAERFFDTLPRDLCKEDEPSGGYAGYALHTIAMIALDKCEDLHPDIFHTSICYAAAAYCRIGIEAVSEGLDRLTHAELEFLDQWWRRCCEEFPELDDVRKLS